MPSLTLFFGPDFADEIWAGRAYTLEPQSAADGAPIPTEWLLGRSPTADLTLSDRHISLRHATISYHPGPDLWSIADLKATNGTRVNSARLSPHDPYPLAVGDKLWLGPNPINVIEDEGDTLTSEPEDDPDLSTIASTTPLSHLPPAAAPPPPPTSDTQAVLAWVRSLPLWVQLLVLFGGAIVLSLWVLQ